ncbi:MAG: aminotransferase class I/II-fold pyridoxal phosphate-dependent enzyme [Elusimicrobia bacterium]|nr:aminotransferase class I/II-fold pyridoxal phosphate-dependent enzyme [Elusimicrobiota bacterium]
MAQPFKPSEALAHLPPYLFVHLIEFKRQAKALGRDIIDLGMGNPDQSTPSLIVEALREAVRNPETHRYPAGKGIPEFLGAAGHYYERRFGVKLDPDKEIMALIGSKEGIAHLFLAMTNPGDQVIIPSPAYPAHTNAPFITRTKPHWAPLLEKNGYLIDFGAIPGDVLRRAKIVILNYPNNPTGAVIEDMGYLKEVLKLSKKYGFLVLYDNPYSEITFDGYRAPSILSLPGAKNRCVEMNSLSKTYSMAGWRIGYALGNAQAIGHLAKFKSFVDYGAPMFIQKAAMAAFNSDESSGIAATYEKRRNAFVKSAASFAGWKIPKVKGSMYLWAKLPAWSKKKTSFDFVKDLVFKTGVCLSPGSGFGREGEGYVRISLVASEERLIEANRRIGSLRSGSLLKEPVVA